MAVNLIISPTFEDAKREILAKIAKNNAPQTSHLVIVPDRHSLSYQRAVIEELNLVSVSNIEVVSFSRLADLNITKDKRYLTPQSAVMLMRKVIGKNRDRLLRYAPASRKVGFADEMFAVVSDIRNSGIQEEQLSSRLGDIDNVEIKNKMSDIALLYAGYMEELKTKYLDATSKFDALIDIIDDIDIIRNSYVYVCDYYEFTNVELQLLEKIMNMAKSTYISLVEREKGSNVRIFPRLSQRLANMAKKNNHHVDIEVHEMPIDSPNRLIYDNLFGYINDAKSACSKDIELHCARNIEEELCYIASDIRKNIREKGLRYRDMAIAVSNIESYKDTIASVMHRYGIPYYVDDKVPIMSAPSVRHILMALEVVEGGYRRNDVISFLMNGLNTDITNDEKDLFTNYVEKYNIDRSRFTHALEIGDNLDVMNSVRERMLQGFDILEENSRKQKMSAHIESIYEYMDAVSYVDRINAFAKAEFDMDYRVDSVITTQAPKKLFRFFDELLMVASDEEMTRREFIDILLASLARVDISLIPKFNDSLYIGDMTTSRYDKVDVMYFAGMTQGAVPADGSVRGIMGEREVEILSTLGMDIEPSPKEKNLLSRFYLLQLLMKSEHKAYLTYPLEGADGKASTPSIVMKQLADIYSMDITPIDTERDVVEYMSTYENASYRTAYNYGRYAYEKVDISPSESRLATYLRDKGIFVPFDYVDSDRLTDIHDLYFNKYQPSDMPRMSASKIESYLRCPYKAYLEYVLNLEKREVSDMEISDEGSILHKMLENLMLREIPLPIADKGKLTHAELATFVHDYVYTEVKEKYGYEDKILRELYNRCVYACEKIYLMLRETCYMPVAVECEIKDEDYEVNGVKYAFKGSIDRVDASGDCSYLVDYKSSSKVDFNLKNIYYGDRVQLVMYGNMYRRLFGGNIVGLFYLPMPDGYTRKEDAEETFRYTGIITRDDIDSMDSHIYPVKYKHTKDGETLVADGGEILEREEFELISDYVDRLIAGVIDDIREGYIAKRPIEGKCKYCEYSNICSIFRGDVLERKISKVDMESFREVHHE